MKLFDKNSVVYISGPMTGMENNNFPFFRSIENYIKENYKVKSVINPANNDQSLSYEDMMVLDLRYVSESTHIVLLPGWNKSKGARAELKVAIEHDLKIITINELIPSL